MSKIKTACAGAAAFAGRHKKAVIALALLVVAAAAAAFLLRGRFVRPVSLPAAGGSYVRTVTLQKGTLEDSISATGTVQSSDVSNVTTDLKYTVKTVNVQVGDSVEEGDVICTLDTSELEESIQKLQESLADAKAEAQKQYEKAQASLTEAEENVKSTYDDMKEAEDERDSAKSAYETAAAAVKSYQAEVDAANADLLTKLNARQAALDAYTAAGGTVDENGDPVTSATSEAASTAADLSALADALVKANGEYKSAEQTLKTAEANLQTAQSASNYTALSSAYNQAQTAYEQAKTTYENAIKTSETAEESRDTALENYNKAGESDELEELQSQLEKCTLKAETSGKVTAVNATVGSAIDGAAATIQDTDSLKISITIAEYDIDSVSEGMHAVITSDVIDGEINGTLTQISPTASGGGSSSSTFSAEVTVDDENSGLLIGTNAKVQIIQSTTEDVFTVPLDAIEEKEDGTSVIYVQSGEENGEPIFEEVQVVVGATNDYYAEVSGVDLEEGMIVRASASLEEATEEVTTPSDMMMGGGEVVIAAPADGGGAMPSGGGGGNMGGGRPGMGG
ncbi:efflux RND transporter periplasmic adaptor subunit [Candidatus Allofournierella excrementavium]|uniref:efflux RND transporter periplasmic adaptor subunit n=1 Tax=Candidatus Allofournierella excrementavium TaxID=2838591 RepID=UPI00374FB811